MRIHSKVLAVSLGSVVISLISTSAMARSTTHDVENQGALSTQVAIIKAPDSTCITSAGKKRWGLLKKATRTVSGGNIQESFTDQKIIVTFIVTGQQNQSLTLKYTYTDDTNGEVTTLLKLKAAYTHTHSWGSWQLFLDEDNGKNDYICHSNHSGILPEHKGSVIFTCICNST